MIRVEGGAAYTATRKRDDGFFVLTHVKQVPRLRATTASRTSGSPGIAGIGWPLDDEGRPTGEFVDGIELTWATAETLEPLDLSVWHVWADGEPQRWEDMTNQEIVCTVARPGVVPEGFWGAMQKRFTPQEWEAACAEVAECCDLDDPCEARDQFRMKVEIGQTYICECDCGLDDCAVFYAFTPSNPPDSRGLYRGESVFVDGEFVRVQWKPNGKPLDPAEWYLWPDGLPQRWQDMTPHDVAVVYEMVSYKEYDPMPEHVKGRRTSSSYSDVTRLALHEDDPCDARDHFRAKPKTFLEQAQALHEKVIRNAVSDAELDAGFAAMREKRTDCKECGKHEADSTGYCYFCFDPQKAFQGLVDELSPAVREAAHRKINAPKDARSYGSWSEGDVMAYLSRFGEVEMATNGACVMRAGLFKAWFVFSEQAWEPIVYGMQPKRGVNHVAIQGSRFSTLPEAMEWAVERWRELCRESDPIPQGEVSCGRNGGEPMTRTGVGAAGRGAVAPAAKQGYLLTADVENMPTSAVGDGWSDYGGGDE